MKIQFTSRPNFIKAIPAASDDCNMISISSTNGDCAKMRRLLSNRVASKTASCFLFLDIDDHSSGFSSVTSGFMFRRINRWFNEPYSNRCSSILIHCDMGVSRSGAVAKWVNDYYKLDDRFLNEYTMYNTYVYQMLMRAAGCDLNSWYKEMENEQTKT